MRLVDKGWAVGQQNCTHRWHEKWSPTTHQLTGERIREYPVASKEKLITPPITLTTPSQPWTWVGLMNPGTGTGNLLKLAFGLFEANGDLYGHAGLVLSVRYLKQHLIELVEGNFVTKGGRMALYEDTGKVVAATQGATDINRNYQMAAVGDPDLEAAAQLLQRDGGQICRPMSADVTFSTAYFMDVHVITDHHPTVKGLAWCAVLLTPVHNVMAPVNGVRTVSIVLVVAMVLVVMTIAFGLVLWFTLPVTSISAGMVALARYDVGTAGRVCGRRSSFSELRSAQQSYDTLVSAIHAFGKYVPHNVVRGVLTGRIKPELGMEPADITVIFLDIENFTGMCEAMEAHDMVPCPLVPRDPAQTHRAPGRFLLEKRVCTRVRARAGRAGQSFPTLWCGPLSGPSRTRGGFFDFEVGGHDGAGLQG